MVCLQSIIYNCIWHEKVSWKWRRRPEHSIMINTLASLILQFQKKLPPKTSQIALECTYECPKCRKFLSSSKFQNIAPNCVRVHRLANLISKVSQQFQLVRRKKGRPQTPYHFPISSKLYFTHATPLVTDFAMIHPRRLTLPNIIIWLK